MALQVGELYAQLTMDSGPFDKGVDGLKGKLGKMGGLVAGALGGVVLAGVTALGGAMVASVASANTFSKAMNGLQTATGATEEEMASMGDAIKNVYARNFGQDINDVAKAMEYAKQATTATGEELEYLTQDALMLRDAFGYEVTDSVKASDKLMRQFGLTGSESMAMIAEATQKGLNKSDDLIDTIDEYSVYFATAGLDAEAMFAIFENASNAGVRNLDYVGDAVKEFGIRAKDGSKVSREAFSALGLDIEEMETGMAKGGETAKNTFLKVIEALQGMEDPVLKNMAGVALFGTKYEDLEADAIKAMGNINGTIKGSIETLDSINAIKYDSFGEVFAGIGRQLQVGLLMPLGEKVLPLLNDFATWIATKIPGMIAYFENFGSQAQGIFARFQPVIQNVMGVIQQMIPVWVGAFQTIMGVVGPVMDFIGSKIKEVVTMFTEFWKKNGQDLLTNVQIVFNGMWAVIQFVMPAVLAIVSMVFNTVKGVITGALNVISGVFKVFAGLFTGDWSKMWDGIKQLVSGAIELLWNLWNLMLFGRLVAGIKLLGTKLLGGFKSMWTGIQNGTGNFISSIQTSFMNMVTSVVGFFKSLYTRGIEIFTSMRTIGASIFEAMKQAIYNIILLLKDKAVSLIGGMKTGITTAFDNILASAKSIFTSVKDAILNPIQTAKDTLLGIIDTIVNAFKNMVIKIPTPKLPKINVGSKSVGGFPIPTFDIDWFKTGGIATGPAIAGIGEAGSEAIVPLAGRRMKPFAEAIAKQMGGVGGGGGDIYVSVTSDELHKMAQAVRTMEDLKQTFRKK